MGTKGIMFYEDQGLIIKSKSNPLNPTVDQIYHDDHKTKIIHAQSNE